MNLSDTEVTLEGSGTGKDTLEALSSGSITLATANLASTTNVESVDNLKIQITAAKQVSVTGTLTLAKGQENVDGTVTFSQGTISPAQLSGLDSATIASVVLTGSGSGAEWNVTKVTVTINTAD